MSWEDLLEDEGGSEQVLPWYGSRQVHSAERSWTIEGPQPLEHGWYRFTTPGGRYCSLASAVTEPDPAYEEGHRVRRGYLVGNRLIPDDVAVVADPGRLVEQTIPVMCVEPGLDRFTRATVVTDRVGTLIFLRQEFPLGPEDEALIAYQDRRRTLGHVKGATPALDLAFRWINYQRELAEERRRELERIREQERVRQEREERAAEALRNAGTAAGRRVVAQHDFETAAREALRMADAELLDCRESYRRGEMVVQYRYRDRRLECVVDRNLRVVDAGVCLEDHNTGVKGDTWLSLESLPSVVGEALDLGKLVVWRHVD